MSARKAQAWAKSIAPSGYNGIVGTGVLHHRRSIRLKGYDYASPGAYFITLVTNQRRLLFGAIAEGEMLPNDPGHMVEAAWVSLPERYSSIEIEAFVVMPNHLHGIIVIRGDVGATFMVAQGRAGMNPAPTVTTHAERTSPALGSIMGAFKSLTTGAYSRGVRDARWTPFDRHLWQRNYYDRIIRNHDEWNRIHVYIESNPSLWGVDEENPLSSRP